MSLRSKDEIGPGKPLVPFSEVQRVNNIERNRELYNGNFTRIGVPNAAGTNESLFGNAYNSDPVETNVRVNWFRRISNFFPEFMMAEPPVITVEGNERFSEYIKNNLQSLFSSLYYSNIDMLRFGEGVIGVDPFNEEALTVYQPDGHYVVLNDLEHVEEDIFVYAITEKEGGNQQPYARKDKVIIIRYPVNGESTRTVYKYEGGSIGDAIGTEVLSTRKGRQVVSLFNGYAFDFQGVSTFTDIEVSVSELSSTLTSLSKTIKRNSRPHLYGPDGALTIDDNGAADVDTQGMYIPLNEGDVQPGYLQWDSTIEAITKDLDWHEKNIFDMTGVSRLLFDGNANTGVMSGVAMKRLMLPFVARLNQIKEQNRQAIIQLLAIVNENRLANGKEYFVYNNSDVQVEWSFEEIFSDVMAVDDEPTNEEDL